MMTRNWPVIPPGRFTQKRCHFILKPSTRGQSLSRAFRAAFRAPRMARRMLLGERGSQSRGNRVSEASVETIGMLAQADPVAQVARSNRCGTHVKEAYMMATLTRSATLDESRDEQLVADEVTHSDIEVRAYYRYLERGLQDGFDLDDWLTAEEELRANAGVRTAAP